jgi:predicted nuclease of predicted toxin-antitoxin system
MKFIVDAQLPKRLAQFLQSEGFDAIHTLDLPNKNRTQDNTISQISIADQRVVISKDSDFYDSFMAKKEPYKLIFLALGNCPNNELIALFSKNISLFLELLSSNDVIQVSSSKVVVVC